MTRNDALLLSSVSSFSFSRRRRERIINKRFFVNVVDDFVASN